jgi:cell division protein FtsZ
VATGIGQAGKSSEVHEAASAQSVKLVQKAGAMGGYKDHSRSEHRPSSGRQKPAGDGVTERAENNMDYLDIPAFLRRQAD